MLQLIGCLMVISGCTGIALVICRDYNSRLHTLSQVRDIYEDMKYYISYQRMTVPEALLKLSEKESAPFAEVFYEIYEAVQEGNSGFPEIWQVQMEKALVYTPLNAAEKKLLLDFPSCLGYMEENAQASALDELQRQVEHHMEELSGEQKNKNKMVMSLGIAGGVLISILLL